TPEEVQQRTAAERAVIGAEELRQDVGHVSQQARGARDELLDDPQSRADDVRLVQPCTRLLDLRADPLQRPPERPQGYVPQFGRAQLLPEIWLARNLV